MELYKLTNKLNGKSYIGATIQGMRQRMKEHQYQAKYNAKFAISQAIREFGMEAFDLEILAEADSYEELMQMEKDAIREYGTMHPNGYNKCLGGRGCPGHQKSLEVRMAVAARTRGRVLSEEHREAIRQAQIGNQHALGNRFTSPVKGIPLSPEVKAKMSAAHIGAENWNARVIELDGKSYATISEAAEALGVCRSTIRKRVAKGRGKYLSPDRYEYAKRELSPEHRAKISAAMTGKPGNATGTRGHEPWNKGLPRTAKEKAKMRAAHALTTNPQCRAIEIDGIVYRSIAEAVRQTSLVKAAIYKRLRTGRARYLNPPTGGELQKENSST
jgi:group I intron endonuclease